MTEIESASMYIDHTRDALVIATKDREMVLFRDVNVTEEDQYVNARGSIRVTPLSGDHAD